jgi:molecular chaperone DnaJ
MQIKDYFAILELEASAPVTDIKKAYRRLALQLHPDKTGNDPYAAARFAEIKEAYEVLTDPSKKEYYLQQRWYNQTAGIRRTEQIVTPATMILQSLELERYVARLDEFRMDREGLLSFMLDLYSDDRLEKLRAFQDSESIHTIVHSVIRSAKYLHPDQAEKIAFQLLKAAPGDSGLAREMADFLQQSRKKKNQEKYTVWLALLLTTVICLIIYLTSR